jgi:hypothetical protein
MVFDLTHAIGMALGSCLIIELGSSAGVTCPPYNFGPKIPILMHLAHHLLHFLDALCRSAPVFQSLLALRVRIALAIKRDDSRSV